MRCKTLYLLPALGLLTGCVAIPAGPQLTVIPGPNKSQHQFVAEDQYCRRIAAQAAGPSPSESAAESTAAGAIFGTALGALAGAAIGGHDGAAVGAGLGMVTGTAIGANQGAMAAGSSQARYDAAYAQCMYAYGNQVPQAGFVRPVYAPPPAPAWTPAPYPPPPPPPPPGY